MMTDDNKQPLTRVGGVSRALTLWFLFVFLTGCSTIAQPPHNSPTGLNPAPSLSDTCAVDSTTGLMWEPKTTDGGLRDRDNKYTWYQQHNNGGSAGYEDASDYYLYMKERGLSCDKTLSSCNTTAYVDAVNVYNLCGYNDWRMPTVDELKTLVDYRKSSCQPGEGEASTGGCLNAEQFPQGQFDYYWSSSPYTKSDYYAWAVSFENGGDNIKYKNLRKYIRLVRRD